jgi:hypothetical protein
MPGVSDEFVDGTYLYFAPTTSPFVSEAGTCRRPTFAGTASCRKPANQTGRAWIYHQVQRQHARNFLHLAMPYVHCIQARPAFFQIAQAAHRKDNCSLWP